MAWLTSLLSKPATIDDERKPSAADLSSADDSGAQPAPAAGGPQMAILAPDIAGISSFRLRFFADAATTAAEIEKLPPEMRHGTHVFWALHDEPVIPPDGHREALVLIRANLTSGIVYAVSFTDMESAWSFARFEAKRGLDISHLIILWAAFATVREELDGVSVLPAAPPATRTQHARASTRSAVTLEPTAEHQYERREEPTISNGAAAPEAPEDAAKLAEGETERRADADRRAEAEEATRQVEAERQAEAEATARQAEADRRAEAEEAARIARQAQDELREARAAADAARALAEAETTRRLEAESRLEKQQQAAADAANSRAAAEQTLTDAALGDGEEPAARGTVFAHTADITTEEDAETIEGPEYLRSADDSGDAGDDLPDAPKLDEFDIAYEVARLLENRRWEKREEPFHGFDSPPGKF